MTNSLLSNMAIHGRFIRTKWWFSIVLWTFTRPGKCEEVIESRCPRTPPEICNESLLTLANHVSSNLFSLHISTWLMKTTGYHQLFSNYHQLFIHYSSSIHQLSSVIINDHQLSSVINDSLIINYSAITQAFCAKSPIFRPSFSSMKARIGAMPVPSATISMGVLCFSGKVTLKGTRGARVLRWNLGLNVGWCWMMLDDVGWC